MDGDLVVGANLLLAFIGGCILILTQDTTRTRTVRFWGKVLGVLCVVPPFLKLYFFAIL